MTDDVDVNGSPSTTTPRFAWGVASGDPTASSVVLWTRIEPSDAATTPLSWEISDEDGSPVQSGSVVAQAEHDGCVHVEVGDLRADARYSYTFSDGGESITGQTATLPESANRFRFTVLCCSRWGWRGWDAFDRIAESEPDLIVHLGDAIYEVGEVPPDGVETDPPHDCESLDDYRRRHRQYRTDPRLRRMLASAPMLKLWDDHEVGDNAPDPGGGERRAAGQRAWADWTPYRRVAEAGALDRQISIGGLVDIAVVDSRFGGRYPNRADGVGTDDDAPATLLAQRQWIELEDFAASSSAPWFVTANQVQVSPMVLGARPVVRRPLRESTWKPLVNPDQWDGYPSERDRLTAALRTVEGSCVILSGDLHSGWSRALCDDDGVVAHEFTCPSVSGTTYSEAVRHTVRIPFPPRLLDRWLHSRNPGIDHLDLRRHGHLECEVTPERFTTTFVTDDGDRHTVDLDHRPSHDGAGVRSR